jgi:hypothetical protein
VSSDDDDLDSVDNAYSDGGDAAADDDDEQ